MATNTSFSPMGSQSQYPQPLQPQQQPADNNPSALPAYLQQNQNAATANPTPNDMSSMVGMPGMPQESKVGSEQPQQQIALPQQANTDSFTFNKKDATNTQSPAFGKKDKKDAKFAGEEDEKKEKTEFASKSPFTKPPSFGEDEKKEKE